MRFRDFAPEMPGQPGAHNSITDVPGVKVGHVTLIEGDHMRTGVTAILPHERNLYHEKVQAAVHSINGFGKATGFEQIREIGTIETPILLTNTLNVGLVWDAVVTYMLRDNPDIGLKAGTVSPVVAECNDGFLSDIRARFVNQNHVWQAIENATDALVAEGNVGAGTGTQCYAFKGGIGSSSRLIPQTPYTVGALVQTNFGKRHELRMLGAPVGQLLQEDYLPQPGPGSVIIVIATDAPLNNRQLTRMARRVTHGLARTGTVSNNGSGDFAIVFSTASTHPHYAEVSLRHVDYLEDIVVMDDLFTGVVEAVEEAVYNALLAARTMTGISGNTLHALPHDKLKDILARYHIS